MRPVYMKALALCPHIMATAILRFSRMQFSDYKCKNEMVSYSNCHVFCRHLTFFSIDIVSLCMHFATQCKVNGTKVVPTLL